MPLILDNSIGDAMQVNLDDVDDLFGDGVPLALPSRPPTKQLQQRLDELRRRGCCQTVAWSKAGTVASVSADGQHIELQYLRIHPETAVWGLSKPTKCAPFSSLAGGPIVHLSWSPANSPELAVIDAVGRVAILSFGMYLNKTIVQRKWDLDPIDDLHSVVGCYWLNLTPTNRQFNVHHGPAVKNGDNYSYEHSVVPSFSPWHPNPAKSSLICITTNGVLKMFWTQNNNKIEETSTELDSITSSDDLVTHAAICPDKNQLFIALATASKQLRVLTARIQWGIPQQDNMKQIPPGSQPLNPTFKVKHIAVTTWLQGGPTEPHFDSPMTQLSHIEMLSSSPDYASQTLTPPIVLTVRTNVPLPNSSYSQEVQSIIDRWEVLVDQQQTLHPAFEQLGSRRNSVGTTPPTSSRLKKIDSIVINKVIIGVQVINQGKVICLTFSDGTVEYRDRNTMGEIWNELDLDRLSSLHQAGFALSAEGPSLQVAVSPTGSSLVSVGEDGKVKWNCFQYALGDLASISDAHYKAAVAGLTLVMASSTVSNNSIDDILAVARPFTRRDKFISEWLLEMLRMLKVSVDYSEDSHHDQLIRNGLLQVSFSILSHLGYNGDFRARSFFSKFSMLALNIRNIVVLVTIANNTTPYMREKLTPLDEPEVVEALAGCCKWSIDLLCWLTDSLYSLRDDPKFTSLLNPTHFSEMNSYLMSKNEISLHFLLCSSTRCLISAICRRISHLDTLSAKAINFYESRVANAAATSDNPKLPGGGPPLALYNAYQKIHRYTSSSLIKVQEFEKLVLSLAADIRHAYDTSLAQFGTQAAAQAQQNQSQGMQKQPTPQELKEQAMKRAQTHIEQGMLLGSSPPAAFLPVITKFFAKDLAAFRAQTDPAKLYFADFDILDVDDEPKVLAAKKARGSYVDVFTRCELINPKMRKAGQANAKDGMSLASGEAGKTLQWRRCVRCGGVMEDVQAVRPGFHFVLAQQAKCACGGRWAVLPRGELVG